MKKDLQEIKSTGEFSVNITFDDKSKISVRFNPASVSYIQMATLLQEMNEAKDDNDGDEEVSEIMMGVYRAVRGVFGEKQMRKIERAFEKAGEPLLIQDLVLLPLPEVDEEGKKDPKLKN